MAKTKRLNHPKSQSPKKLKDSLILAIFLIILGLIGLLLATRDLGLDLKDYGQNNLSVIDGINSETNQSQDQAGSNLQEAAKIKDFLNGRSGQDFQSGSSGEELLQSKDLK